MNCGLFGRMGAAKSGLLASDAGPSVVVQTAWAVGSFAVIGNMFVDRRSHFE
jgi:hypothetical protein